jgi:hypothetical protein
MSDLKSKRKLGIILLLPLFFAIFLGTYHHYCDYHSKTCQICSQSNNQQVLFLNQADTAENIQPPMFTSHLFLIGECLPDAVLSLMPLKGRAPPILS